MKPKKEEIANSPTRRRPAKVTTFRHGKKKRLGQKCITNGRKKGREKASRISPHGVVGTGKRGFEFVFHEIPKKKGKGLIKC